LTLRAAERAVSLLNTAHPDFIDVAAFEERFSITRPRRPSRPAAEKAK
jgi:hypothetical protein